MSDRAMHERPLVYVAGPYTHPDPVRNTHQTLQVAEILLASDLCAVHVPHLTILWHIVCPHEETHWYALDLAVLKRCDALFRLPGRSFGADNEVRFAHEHGIPVFFGMPHLLTWLRQQG